MSQNAFPVSGQLYTTHLLSLEALLTVIDSTEAHCQAKILSNTLQQDKKEANKTTTDNAEGPTESIIGNFSHVPYVPNGMFGSASSSLSVVSSWFRFHIVFLYFRY